jgi:hypothetical protein
VCVQQQLQECTHDAVCTLPQALQSVRRRGSTQHAQLAGCVSSCDATPTNLQGPGPPSTLTKPCVSTTACTITACLHAGHHMCVQQKGRVPAQPGLSGAGDNLQQTQPGQGSSSRRRQWRRQGGFVCAWCLDTQWFSVQPRGS